MPLSVHVCFRLESMILLLVCAYVLLEGLACAYCSTFVVLPHTHSPKCLVVPIHELLTLMPDACPQ